ncbi:hypothetical protein AgCh_038863 [Apium graveolens]
MAAAYIGCLRHRKQGGIQKLWMWDSDEHNPSGMIFQSASGLLMAIDIAGVHLEEASPYMDLSKNDLYAVSAIVSARLQGMLRYTVI